MINKFTDDDLNDFGQLLDVAGPSGYESVAIHQWLSIAKKIPGVTVGIDSLGGAYAKLEPANGTWNKAILLDAHIDELGLVINHIDDQGMLWFQPIGGWDPVVLPAQKIVIHSRRTHKKVARGVIGRKPTHLQTKKEEEEEEIKIKDLWIDIGNSKKEETEEKVEIGDYAVIENECALLNDHRIMSKALDDRTGCFTILAALKLYAEMPDRKNTLIAVASLREEAGSVSSARFPQFNPSQIIVVDVTHATDQPNVEEKETGTHPLGSGPAINIGTMLSSQLISRLEKTAQANNIPFTIEVNGSTTWTNAEDSWLGAPKAEVALVAIPLRYMHTPVEIIELDDVWNTARLIAHYVDVT